MGIVSFFRAVLYSKALSDIATKEVGKNTLPSAMFAMVVNRINNKEMKEKKIILPDTRVLTFKRPNSKEGDRPEKNRRSTF